MTNGKEESIYGQIILPFVAFAFTIHHMCALNSIVSIESKCVGFIEDFNVFGSFNAAFHGFRSTQIGLAYYHINL